MFEVIVFWSVLAIYAALAVVGVVVGFTHRDDVHAQHVMQGLAAATPAGLVGVLDERSVVLHERVHMWTLAPWLAAICRPAAWFVLHTLGVPWYLALPLTELIVVAFHFVNEVLADGVAYLVYRQEYVDVLEEVYTTSTHDLFQGPLWLFLLACPMYAHRFVLLRRSWRNREAAKDELRASILRSRQEALDASLEKMLSWIED